MQPPCHAQWDTGAPGPGGADKSRDAQAGSEFHAPGIGIGAFADAGASFRARACGVRRRDPATIVYPRTFDLTRHLEFRKWLAWIGFLEQAIRHCSAYFVGD